MAPDVDRIIAQKAIVGVEWVASGFQNGLQRLVGLQGIVGGNSYTLRGNERDTGLMVGFIVHSVFNHATGGHIIACTRDHL